MPVRPTDLLPGEVAPFSTATPGASVPEGWRVTQLPGVAHQTRYEIVSEGGQRVLHAVADRSMAGLSQSVAVDPARRPWIVWRWKVDDVVAAGTVGSKASDDYAARLYVLFDYDLSRLSFLARMKVKMARSLYGEAVPAAALCYVWDSRAPVGTIVPSAYTDRVRMVVVASGNASAGRWVELRRNVADDFRAAFGEAAPRIVGVAIATDTDNTGGRVEAWYGDIRFAGDAGGEPVGGLDRAAERPSGEAFKSLIESGKVVVAHPLR